MTTDLWLLFLDGGGPPGGDMVIGHAIVNWVSSLNKGKRHIECGCVPAGMCRIRRIGRTVASSRVFQFPHTPAQSTLVTNCEHSFCPCWFAECIGLMKRILAAVCFEPLSGAFAISWPYSWRILLTLASSFVPEQSPLPLPIFHYDCWHLKPHQCPGNTAFVSTRRLNWTERNWTGSKLNLFASLQDWQDIQQHFVGLKGVLAETINLAQGWTSGNGGISQSVKGAFLYVTNLRSKAF